MAVMSAEYMREYRKKRKGDGTPLKGGKHKVSSNARYQQQWPKEIVFLDGEGTKDDEGNDHYWLLQDSLGNEISCSRESRLSTQVVLDYLFSLRRPRRFLVAFGAKYDITHWLRDLDDEQYQAAKTPDGCHIVCGEYTYWIRRFGYKILGICRRRVGTREKWTGIKICDCQSFFGCSFVKALEDWKVGTLDDLTYLERLKALRGEFRTLPDEEISTYNRLECRLGAELMARLDDAVEEATGRRLTSYHGAGALAALLLKIKGVKPLIEAHRAIVPEQVEAIQHHAFFGGRFQCLTVGIIPDCSEVDICSAYPAAMLGLPGTSGHWCRTKKYEPGCLGFWRVRWNIPDQQFTPFPWRGKDGRIHYPPRGHGWYHCVEVDAALSIWGDCIRVLEGWVYDCDPEDRPFAEWVPEAYQQRIAWGKSGKGMVLKLALNSCYGKMAQKQIDKLPPYRLPFYAGQITATTRAAILRYAAPVREQLVAIATDGILLRGTAPAGDYGKALGQFEPPKAWSEIGIWQPGIYYKVDASGQVEIKARGIAEKEVDIESLKNAWEPDYTGREGSSWFFAKVPMPTRERFYSRDLAIHQGAPERAYRWSKEGKHVQLCPGSPGAGAQIFAMNVKVTDTATYHRWPSWDPAQVYSVLSHSYDPGRKDSIRLQVDHEAAELQED